MGLSYHGDELTDVEVVVRESMALSWRPESGGVIGRNQ